MKHPESTAPHIVLGEVRRILDQRLPAERTISAIRQILDPPSEPRSVELTDGGWPVLRPSTWEQHDDPEVVS